MSAKKTVLLSNSHTMKENTIRSIKVISITAIVMMAIVTSLDTYFWTERWKNIDWNPEFLNWQRTIVIGHIASTYLLTAAVITFIVNVLKNLKKGVIFCRANTSVIYAGAAIFFLYSNFATTAQNAAEGIYVFAIDTNTLICPLLIIIMGLLHKLAVEASEENSLTI